MRTFQQLLLLLCIGVPSLATLSTADDPVHLRREITVADGNGGVFDITHEINSNMPSWESKNGLGHLLRLVDSMKNGSVVNKSVFKLSTHTGIHCDAPGHFYDEYYDSGYNVNIVDFDVK